MTEGITRTSLTRFAGLMQDPDPARKRRMLWELYEKYGVLVVTIEDVERGFVAQMMVESLAKNLYRDGRRR